MATNTLIQKLFAADESGVGEDSSRVSNREQKETFRCGEAGTTIVVGDRLVVSAGGKLIQAPSYRTDIGDGTGTTPGAVTQQNLIVAIAMEGSTTDASSRVFVLNNW